MNCTNVVYRCSENLVLIDLPSDVLKRLSKTIGQDFLSRINSVTVQDLEPKNGAYDIYDVLYCLGDKEGWEVQNLVPVLMEMNNSTALKELLRFWPPRILTKPPVECWLEAGAGLEVSVEVAGHPEPQIEWRNEQDDVVGHGPELRLFHNIQYGCYTVIATNMDKSSKAMERYHDSAMFNVMCRPRFGPRIVYPVVPAIEENPPVPVPVKHGMEHRSSQEQSGRSDFSSPARCPLLPHLPLGAPIGKIALLIGLGNYRDSHYTRLEGPSHDLPAFAQRLAKIDFRVVTLQDLDLPSLNTAIDIYLSLLYTGVYGVLYLSGHGVRFPDLDDDFLIPVDAPGDRHTSHCLSRQSLIARLQQRTPDLNFVIWDACRSAAHAPEIMSGGRREQYSEANLFEFRSSTALTYSYDTKNGSAIMIPFLELLGDMSQQLQMGDLLTMWKRRVDQKNLQIPSIVMGGSSTLSLWDKIVKREGVTQIFRRIFELWCEDYALDESKVFPKLSISCPPEMPFVSILHRFLVHNVVELKIVSVNPEWLVEFDLKELRRWRCGVEVFEDPSLPPDASRRVILRDLQLLATGRSASDRSPLADAVKVPCLVRHYRADYSLAFCCTIEHIRLIQLFRQRPTADAF